jgi:hypothetical protein
MKQQLLTDIPRAVEANATGQRQLMSGILTAVAAMLFLFAGCVAAVFMMYWRWHQILPDVSFAQFVRLFIRHLWA